MSKLKGFNVFQAMTNCLCPEVIINPKLPELIFQFGNYVIDGVLHRLSVTPFGANCLNMSLFHPVRNNITLKNIDDCFVLDPETGEQHPLYFVVPCGKCDICKDSKCSNFARRCQYETQLYDCPPVHITITYDDFGLPGDKSVSVREMQLWKKRFRICLERSNYGEFVDGVWSSPRLRICIAAEYGKRNTLRPHYHVLIWNLKPIGRFSYEYLRSLAWLCWNKDGIPKCIRRRFTLYPITDDYVPAGCKKSLREMGKTSYQAFGYVAKYFYKEDASCVPPGRKPLFHLMSKSKGLGGIGAPFIDKHKIRMRKGLHKSYQFLDKWSQSVQELQYDRYVFNRVFPSRFQSVPYRVRREMKFLCHYLSTLSDPGLIERFLPIKTVLSQLYPVLFSQEDTGNYCWRSMMTCKLLVEPVRRLICENALSYLEVHVPEIDIGLVLELDRLRHVMLGKLFLNKKSQDVYRRYQKMCLRRKRRDNEFLQL